DLGTRGPSGPGPNSRLPSRQDLSRIHLIADSTWKSALTPNPDPAEAELLSNLRLSENFSGRSPLSTAWALRYERLKEALLDEQFGPTHRQPLASETQFPPAAVWGGTPDIQEQRAELSGFGQDDPATIRAFRRMRQKL